ncbi:MAG: MgtC/SapB family protein [Bauldia sp.]|nr:MgtC/SapB family protein [Bauldia sp.]
MQHLLPIVLNLGAAWFAGAVIGLERSFHGLPAGFRTHALVCLASALLMVVFNYQMDWLGDVPVETLRSDPTRMAQGIMTGIGFLGAGVIFKEGLTVRGLTTAASIWTTAAIGILFGVGFFAPAAIATVIALGTLSLFRHVENRMPAQIFAQHTVRFPAERTMAEPELRRLLEGHGFAISNMSYRLDEGRVFEYRMMLRTLHKQDFERLATDLRTTANVLEFRISPPGD